MKTGFFDESKRTICSGLIIFLIACLLLPYGSAFAVSADTAPYSDANIWAEEAILWAYTEGLMTGTTSTTFSPNVLVDRAMLVTILYRMAQNDFGALQPVESAEYADLDGSEYYYEAAMWASANSIIPWPVDSAFSPFSPNSPVSRIEMVSAMLKYYYYCEKINFPEGPWSSLVPYEIPQQYTDKDSINAGADLAAIKWAMSQNLVSGKTESSLAPYDTTTRAELATIIFRWKG